VDKNKITYSDFVILFGTLVIVIKAFFPDFKTDDSVLLGVIILFIGVAMRKIEEGKKGG